MSVPTVTYIKDVFHYQASEFDVNKEYPSKHESQEVRKKVMKNLTKLSCLESNFDKFKWAIILARSEAYAKTIVETTNKQRLTRAMDRARAALAQQNPPGDPTTVTAASVSND